MNVGCCLRAREKKKEMVLISFEGKLILDNNGCHMLLRPTSVNWTDFGAQIENDFHNIFSFVTKNQCALFVVFMTSPFDIDISMICSKLTQPCIRMCGKLCRNKDYRCFFLCTDWISQHPFRPLVFIDNRRVLRHRLPYCLTVVWVWSNKESVEYRRSRHHCVSRPQLDSLGQYTWLVVSKPCFPANLQRYTLIFKMRLLVWESLLLPTEQCLQCLWGRENIFVSFQLLLCYCFSSTPLFSQLPIVELQVLLIRFVAKHSNLSIKFDLSLLIENLNRGSSRTGSFTNLGPLPQG